MAIMTNFKTVVKSVNINNEEFVLFSFDILGVTDEMKKLGINDHAYGTIKKSEISNDGKIIGTHSLADFAHGDTINDALTRRERREKIKNLSIEELKDYFTNN